MKRRLVSCAVLAGALLALPAAAQPVIDVVKVAEGVWGAKPPSGANVGWFVAGDGVVVVDAGESPAIARAVLAKIAETAKKPVRTLILTHAHADHTGGIRVFAAAGAQVVCHESAASAVAAFVYAAPDAKDPADARAPAGIPIVTVSERMVFVSPTQQVQVYWLGAAHTSGDLLVLLPREKVLFSGDVAINAPVPYMQAPNCDALGWERVLVRLAGLSLDKMVPGHGAIGPIAGIQTTGLYVQKVNKLARMLLETGVPEEYYIAKLKEPDNEITGVPVTDEHVANVKAVARAERERLTRKPPEKKG
jgi:cyclase